MVKYLETPWKRVELDRRKIKPGQGSAMFRMLELVLEMPQFVADVVEAMRKLGQIPDVHERYQAALEVAKHNSEVTRPHVKSPWDAVHSSDGLKRAVFRIMTHS
jgi:hypothetical protein